ncbi:hypothetical protein FK178_09725 [Antarcticibacterium arcticum]|uniref:Uncharacterized protein n=1 Tax=Antarcticibacterium arcticum TaxID=2585771 RepID=A0A5B8YME8_9FLAO|nr:hypothetical protein [Antarcticibacterium arcticum]QED37987.1 hypothetical protein FK178_09725 [Antarcticibacterium arcticum]
MKTLFKNLGFDHFQENKEGSIFLANYCEAKLDGNVYYKEDPGFINKGVEKDLLNNDLLPSLSIFDPAKITEFNFTHVSLKTSCLYFI